MGTFKCGQKFQLSGAPSNTRQLSPVHVHRGGQFCTGTSVLTRRIGHGAHAVRAVKCVHSCMRNALRAPCEQMVGPSLGAKPAEVREGGKCNPLGFFSYTL